MNIASVSQPSLLRKSGVFLLFLIVESLVFAIITLSPYLPKDMLIGFHAGFTTVCLTLSLLLRKSKKGKPFWPVFFAFFVAGAAVLISALFSNDLLRLLKQTVATPQGIATAKFSESILRIIPILVLMPIAGFDWRSMYLKMGKIRTWLPIAISALVVFPALSFFLLSNGQAGVLNKLLPLWPWILLFVLCNGFMEELLYRGILLKRYEPFIGKNSSVILTAVVFAIMHTQVTYASQMIQFILIVTALSLIWGVLIQKTESLWGAVLFHAAADTLIIFGAFASM